MRFSSIPIANATPAAMSDAITPEAPLRIALHFTRADKAADPYGFQSGSQAYIFHRAGGGAKTAWFDWDDDLFAALAALAEPDCDPAVVQRVGDRLRAFVEATDWPGYEAEIAAAVAARRAVHLTILANAAELYALPWELLTLADTGQHLGTLPTVLIRYAWPETRACLDTPAPRPEGGRIVFAYSDAGGWVPADEHRAALGQTCVGGYQPFVQARDEVAAVSYAALDRALGAGIDSGRSAPRSRGLGTGAAFGQGAGWAKAGAGVAARVNDRAGAREPISVVHILCHGVRRGQTMALRWHRDRDDGRDGDLHGADLRALIAPHAGHLRLVVLCACDSGNPGALGNHLGSLAQALHRVGVEAVVASRFPLSVFAANQFAHAFYRALLQDPASVEDAFLAARTHVHRRSGGMDWASLQLYAHPPAANDDTGGLRPVVIRPYRGLLAFQPEHRRLFFGRQAEVAGVLADLDALRAAGRPRFLVVAGASGTGKSSLVRAGVVPAFIEAGAASASESTSASASESVVASASVAASGTDGASAWRYAVMRPGDRPLAALDRALARRPAPEQPFLLVVDQLEEIFTHRLRAEAAGADTAAAAGDGHAGHGAAKDIRQRFVRRLWSLSQEDAGFHCIVTIRVDFLGHCGEIVLDHSGNTLDRVAYDEAHRVFVAQMDRTNLRAVLTESAHAVGLRLQAGLAERMLDDVSGEPGALPLVEHALDALWRERDGAVLTATAYGKLGGPAGAIEREADTVLAGMSKDERACARRLLVHLVAVRGDHAVDTRRRLRLGELADMAGAHRAALPAVLDKLVSARLIVRDEQPGAEASRHPVLELAHEALIRRWAQLQRWVEEDRDKLAALQQLRALVAQKADNEALLQGKELDYAQGIQARYPADVPAPACALIRASEAAQRRTRRQRLGLLAAAVAVAVGMPILLVWAMALDTLADQRAKETAASQLRTRDARRMAGVREIMGADPMAAAALLSEVEAAQPDVEVLGWRQAVYDVLAQPLGQVLRRGQGQGLVRSARFSPDGTRIVTASLDGTARVWTIDNLAQQVVLAGHAGPVYAADFSPDGARIVTASEDGTARIWRADGQGLPVVLQGHRGAVYAADFSPDGTRVVTASADGTARVWRSDGTGPTVVLQGHTGGLSAVRFSPDGARVVTASWDGTARVWRADGKEASVVLRGHEGTLYTADFSPDGARVVTASWDGTARVWRADGKGAAIVLAGHEARVRMARFSPDGTRVVTASWDGTARVWRANGQGVPVVLAGHEGLLSAARFSPDGAHVVTASWDGTARVWRADGKGAPVILRGHEHWVWSVDVSPDGMRIVTASWDGTTRVWRVGDQGQPVVLRGHVGTVHAAGFSPDGTRVVTAADDGTARLWRTDRQGRPGVLRGHAGAVFAASFSPDGAHVVTGSEDGTARLWGVANHDQLAVLAGHAGPVYAASFSPDGTRIVTASADGTARVWRGDSQGPPVVLRGHRGTIYAADFSADGTRIVTASADGTARVWRADGKGPPVVLGSHEGPVKSASFSPEGGFVVTVSQHGPVRVWRGDGQDSVVVLHAHADSIHAVSFSPDGSHLVAALVDGTVRILRADGEGLPVVLAGHKAMVRSAHFSADGTLVVSASADGTARIWPVTQHSLWTYLARMRPQCLTPWQRHRLLGEPDDTAAVNAKDCAQKPPWRAYID